MPFYTFETIPVPAGRPVRRYELWQALKNPLLARHPETGEPLRRIYPLEAKVRSRDRDPARTANGATGRRHSL